MAGNNPMTAARLEELAGKCEEVLAQDAPDVASILELADIADLARCAREVPAMAYRLRLLDSINQQLLKQMGNIRLACQPDRIKTPDGKEWSFHPPDDQIRTYWEHLSKHVRAAIEAIEAAEVKG